MKAYLITKQKKIVIMEVPYPCLRTLELVFPSDRDNDEIRLHFSLETVTGIAVYRENEA
jgi:hypothetical protein